MQKLSDYIGRNLIIQQTSIWKREYELRSGNEVLAEMKYPKLLSEMVECIIGDEKLAFRRPNIFSDTIEIKKQGFELPIAIMDSNFFATKATLELPRGRKVIMKFRLFKNQADIFYGENDLLVKFHNKISFKEKSNVIIEKRSEILDDYPWIIFLAFYYAQLKRKNSGIAY
ncbi:Hypothetical protein IALB_0202 [Ignavibacterium album JCM 16511]|uniref:Uncharacterized protein n=1 Tax=Ignavibacterium album (strain DSM 19864 / JCM 16511 / NBRC 101810 / Mat9-16) TaxID=945713 RepID=I0AG07_IGNAJ|nr:hypothetical protein [Ignavibacterium album]AFH47914.1 Hypothetical protein IALB_0202 [Ignavibacterium album JCM 16511]